MSGAAPRSNEPFAVNDRLGAGKSFTYQTGTNATTDVLTHQDIYKNPVGSTEGDCVVTGAGTVAKRCA